MTLLHLMVNTAAACGCAAPEELNEEDMQDRYRVLQYIYLQLIAKGHEGTFYQVTSQWLPFYGDCIFNEPVMN